MWALRSITLIAGLFSIPALAATTSQPAPKVVFFGDTITALLSSNGNWPANWVNMGVNLGPNQFETTAQELARFPDVLARHPAIVHIIPGIGDVESVDYNNQDFIMQQIESNVRKMIEEARNAHIQVILGTVAPVYDPVVDGNPFIWGNLNGFQILAMNAWIESYGAQKGIPVENYHDLLCGLDNVVTLDYIYAYNCVGSTDPNQGLIGGLPYVMHETGNGGIGQVFPSYTGNQAIIEMAQTAISTLGLTIKSGYLGNTYSAPLTGSPQQTGVNNVPASSTVAVQFVPYGVFSDGVARPMVNTNFEGMNGFWTSSDPNVMTINQDGTARAFVPGKTRISYTSMTGVIFSPWDMTVRQGIQ